MPVNELKSARPVKIEDTQALRQSVEAIIARVEKEGDRALSDYSRIFDGYEGPIRIGEAEIAAAKGALPPEIIEGLDYAIAQGMTRVEAGAQGEHKLARGYMPNITHSLHWIRDPGFAEAVKDYLTQERRAVDHEVEVLTDYGPFKKIEEEDHD